MAVTTEVHESELRMLLRLRQMKGQVALLYINDAGYPKYLRPVGRLEDLRPDQEDTEQTQG